jgi:peptidoglycan/LPS O-acetylase OafA/YrhL
MEEHFYLIWPVALAMLGNKRARNAALAGMAVICLWRVWVAGHFTLPGIPTLQRTDMRLDAFLAPCVFAIMSRSTSWKNRATRWLSPTVCALLLVGLALLRLLPDAGALFASLRQLVQACVLPLLIISTVLRPTTPFRKIPGTSLPAMDRPHLVQHLSLANAFLQPAGLVECSHQIFAVEDRGYFGIGGA